MSTEKAVFDPSKNYAWGAESQFTLDGKSFELSLNSLRALLSTPENQRIVLAYEALKNLEQIFVKAVEDGTIKEQVKQ